MVQLEAIRACLDGVIPSVIATCGTDGAPNLAFASQVHFIDAKHVALSFQFFNKTRENILANPYATVQVVHPDTAQSYQLALRYLRTETYGPLFENMKAHLAGLAVRRGMSGVFRLRGSDIYQVLNVTETAGRVLPAPEPRYNRLTALRACVAALGECKDLDSYFDEVLRCLVNYFDMRHALLLLLDESGKRLFTVASHGYAESGIGSEVMVGEGVVGIAAEQRAPIRITHMANDYHYNAVLRASDLHYRAPADRETTIAVPTLDESGSQLAVPILLRDRLLGVLYVESPQQQRFAYDDEDALVILAHYLALELPWNEAHEESWQEMHRSPANDRHPLGIPSVVRHYAIDHSVFIDEQYLIKGVAGAIFWKLVREHRDRQRSDFCNRELRLDPTLGLPAVIENLEARLILLQRRLSERCPFVAIEKTGRGRFHLRIDRSLHLIEA